MRTGLGAGMERRVGAGMERRVGAGMEQRLETVMERKLKAGMERKLGKNTRAWYRGTFAAFEAFSWYWIFRKWVAGNHS